MNLDEAVIVALGSNLPGAYGSPQELLEVALERLPAAGFKVLLRSAWWRSAAWPDPAKPDYLNGVVLVETSLPPAEALSALHVLEEGFGRERRETNAPRTLDLDLIAHGRVVTPGEGPRVPHPRAAERYFVMGPLAQIARDWRHPVSGKTAAELAASASVGRDASPID